MLMLLLVLVFRGFAGFWVGVFVLFFCCCFVFFSCCFVVLVVAFVVCFVLFLILLIVALCVCVPGVIFQMGECVKVFQVFSQQRY